MTAAALRLATRGSRLARAQAVLAAERLRSRGIEVGETVVVRTQGDEAPSTPVGGLQGEGWFSAALEVAIAEGRADVAVHSAKDLPSGLGDGLTLAAFLERADPRDGLISRDGRRLMELPAGAVIGTGSARRAALLRALRPDLSATPVRGNVDTRLRRLGEGGLDGLLLACAGLDRIGAADRLTERLDPRIFVPAPCQGAIALETAALVPAAAACRRADDAPTRAAAAAERAVLAELGGGCLLPLGAWARVEEGRLILSAALESGDVLRRAELSGDLREPEELGARVAARLR
ncbi:MAG: hydroxymethylbilane synthase [Candidatus Dormibacteria bacterium]